MKRNRWKENPQGLEPLADQAKDDALHMMRTTGSMPPTVIADTDEGYVFCMPSELTDDAAKDRFAEVNLCGYKRLSEPNAAAEYDPVDLINFIKKNFLPLNMMMERTQDERNGHLLPDP